MGLRLLRALWRSILRSSRAASSGLSMRPSAVAGTSLAVARSSLVSPAEQRALVEPSYRCLDTGLYQIGGILDHDAKQGPGAIPVREPEHIDTDVAPVELGRTGRLGDTFQLSAVRGHFAPRILTVWVCAKQHSPLALLWPFLQRRLAFLFGGHSGRCWEMLSRI